MQTRTLILTFTGAGTQPLPGGRFLFIKSATAALRITLTEEGGVQSVLDGVGAGARQRRLNAAPWRFTNIESQVAQVVELILSEDAEFDVANSVSVTGAVNAILVATATLTDTADQLLADAAEFPIAANPARRRIIVGVPTSSTNWVRVSKSGGTGRGIEITPGTWASFETLDALVVRNDNGAGDSSDATFYLEEET